VRYGAVMNAVEINSSFYRPHRRETSERWAASVPGDFRFAVKLPRTITHERRLADVRALLDGFLSQVVGLDNKLGPLLVQLPPSLRFDQAVAERFLDDLRARHAGPIVCEPRHASWFTPDVEALLAERRVARVAADPAPVAGAGEAGGWPALAYRRLHGSPRIYYSPYSPEFLTATARALADERARGIESWCVFDNTAEFAALGDALTVMRLLAGPSS
jgi:uncharacterized protein YecE (DUF72 family)